MYIVQNVLGHPIKHVNMYLGHSARAHTTPLRTITHWTIIIIVFIPDYCDIYIYIKAPVNKPISGHISLDPRL